MIVEYREGRRGKSLGFYNECILLQNLEDSQNSWRNANLYQSTTNSLKKYKKAHQKPQFMCAIF
jgi:hypothetical protein